MTDRPIIFSAPMVLALLAGTKTQTRRAIKDQTIGERFCEMRPEGVYLEWLGTPCCGTGVWDVPEYSGMAKVPYGVVGDQLWVRELHAIGSDGRGEKIMSSPLAGAPENHMWGSTFSKNPAAPEGSERWCLQWKRTSPMFMPRWASRITLELTEVRVERLQDISEADCIAEGIERSGECNWRDYADKHNDFTSARRSYRSLWESINGPGSWAANPWLWCLSFKRV